MINQPFSKFWQSFSRPQVFIFILIGSGVIFLTFLTRNNAIEITISGFASVFIGIGVNNFTSYQTHHRDELAMKRKIAHALQILDLVEDKIDIIHDEADNGKKEEARKDFKDLTRYIFLLKQVLKEDEPLP
ncbi:MAG: hypothetical protein J7578_00170 [Chitinophagaceae bacterium]|nr:hypothetical protein [Chitinophagaceae bacterium]